MYRGWQLLTAVLLAYCCAESSALIARSAEAAAKGL